MTRVLIIGSSHVGAYKNAAAAFGALYPDVTLDFFGVRGPLFLSGTMDANGVFTPPWRDDKDRDFVQQTNGTTTADASSCDHLVMLGHRFGFKNYAALLEDHDILEGIRTGRPRLISEDFLKETIATVTDAAVAEATDAIAPADKPATFIMAPYPAASITERGDTYELSRLLRLFWARPDAAWVFDMWLTQVNSALTARGHHLLAQPDTLNAGPYATKPDNANRASALGDGNTLKTDHRHMNADYGLAMLGAYAQTHLGLTPQVTPAPPTQREEA